jgi:hypothetical protein
MSKGGEEESQVNEKATQETCGGRNVLSVQLVNVTFLDVSLCLYFCKV